MRTANPPSADKNMSSAIAPPTESQARFAFIILLIINILNYTDRSILSAVQVSIQSEFRLQDTELGLLSSSFLFIYGISTLPIGVWADKGIRKNIIALCVGIWSIATGLGGFTVNFIQLFLTRSVLGIGEAGYAPASLSMIGDSFPKTQRGRMLSFWSIGNLIGTALGLIAGGYIDYKFGWRWAFYIVGIPGLIAAFLIWRSVEPKRGAFDDADGADADAGGTVHEGFKSDGGLKGALVDLWNTIKILSTNKTYWLLTAAFICTFFIIGAAMAWMPTYLHRGFRLSIKDAGTVAGGILAGGSLVGTLLGGWLADTLQKRLAQGRMIVSAIAFLAGAPLTWLALSLQNLPAFIAVFIVAIIFLSLSIGPIQAIFQDIIAPDRRSTSMGLALLLGHLLGDALSPVIVGSISDHYHSLSFSLMITAPTCLLLAGIICLFGIKTVAGDMKKMQEALRAQIVSQQDH